MKKTIITVFALLLLSLSSAFGQDHKPVYDKTGTIKFVVANNDYSFKSTVDGRTATVYCKSDLTGASCTDSRLSPGLQGP